MLATYLRKRNIAVERFDTDLSSSAVDNRGLVNEAGFRIFGKARVEGVPVLVIPPDVLTAAAQEALLFIERFRQPTETLLPLSPAGIQEARWLASRLEDFIGLIGPSKVTVQPTFRGCGWLDECDGDLLLDSMLCEVKSGEGPFQSRDIRQLLTYAALNSAAGTYRIDGFCLVNPRRGVFLRESAVALSSAIAGTSFGALMAEIIDHLSQPEWRDEIV